MIAALLLAASAAPAPIAISECAVLRTQSYERGLAVIFRNTSAEPIVKVVFHVHNGAHAIDVTDHGTFSPETDIDHVLATPTWELHHGDATTCTVASVTFANGKTWEAPKHP